jgi:hypothetical protein
MFSVDFNEKAVFRICNKLNPDPGILLIKDPDTIQIRALKSCVADPHHLGKLHPHPHQREKLDPDPHQNGKLEALEGYF